MEECKLSTAGLIKHLVSTGVRVRDRVSVRNRVREKDEVRVKMGQGGGSLQQWP